MKKPVRKKRQLDPKLKVGDTALVNFHGRIWEVTIMSISGVNGKIHYTTSGNTGFFEDELQDVKMYTL